MPLTGSTIQRLNYAFYRFNDALNSQPRGDVLQQNYFLWSGYLCIVIGCVFVFSSYFALGFYGTFLGEFFSNVVKNE